jgi:hypothetical protein
VWRADSGMEEEASEFLQSIRLAVVHTVPTLWKYLNFSVDIPDRIMAPLTLRIAMLPGPRFAFLEKAMLSLHTLARAEVHRRRKADRQSEVTQNRAWPAAAPADMECSGHRPEILKAACLVRIPNQYALGFPSNHSVCPRCRRTTDISPDGRCTLNSCENAHPKFFLVNTKLLKAGFKPKFSRCFMRNCNSACRLVEKSFQSSMCRAFNDGSFNLCASADEYALEVSKIVKKFGTGRKTAYFKIRKVLTPLILEVFNPNVNGSILGGLLRELLHIWHAPVQPTTGKAETIRFWMNRCPFAFVDRDLSKLRVMFREFQKASICMNTYPFACVRMHCTNVLAWTKQLRILLPIRIARVVWKIASKTFSKTLRNIPPGVLKSEIPASEGDLLFNSSVWTSESVLCYNKHVAIARSTQKFIQRSASACERLVDDIECIFWPVFASLIFDKL